MREHQSKIWRKVMRVTMATALQAMPSDHKYGWISSQSTFLGATCDRMQSLTSKAHIQRRNVKRTNGTSVGTCRIDVSEHEGSMFRILINLHECAVVADFKPQPLKKVPKAHAYAGTGKVRYIKSIGWCFCESAVSGRSCATSGVGGTMPFTALKLLQEKKRILR